jgi:protein-tyrosine phosphatase
MTQPQPPRVGVLMVCLGNICRSPMAKGVLLHLARARRVDHRLDVDSCGTGSWHVGGPADPRTLAVMAAKNIPLAHVARQFSPGDLDRFDWILAMDRANVRALVRKGAPRERVRMLRAFDPALARADEPALEVPDPYYGGPEGFEHMHAMITAACDGFLDHLAAADRLT